MSSSIPKMMKAYVALENGTAGITSVPVPTPSSNELLIKVTHIAQNPTDWKRLRDGQPPLSIIGCDFSGSIISLPSSPSSPSSWAIGDQVAGFVHGGAYTSRGAFAEYLVAEEDLVWKVPEGMGGREACGFGIPFAAAAKIICTRLGLPFPGEPKVPDSPWILIYGGSTSIALFSIQFAKLAGYRVIATCSPHNFDLVRGYGADEVVDYHDPARAVEEIRRITAGGVTKAHDTIGSPTSLQLCIACFSSQGGRLQTGTPIDEVSAGMAGGRGVVIDRTFAYTLLGLPFGFKTMQIPASKADREFYVKLCKATPSLISEFGIKPARMDLRKGELGGISEGLEVLKRGEVPGGVRYCYQL